MERFLCIHGHFYQPPRENPWLEIVEIQDSAYPYHDWNDRINAECYAPNTAARILGEHDLIRKIRNNYSRISFNFGPTLLDWLENSDKAVYDEIIKADRTSRHVFSGHGSALAQTYNHIIMPLASRQDKYTQVRWGIEDFEYRFGRKPEGMWLPETAVDLETLDILAQEGIKFTILSPYQALRQRPCGSEVWQDVGSEGIDPTMSYLLTIPETGRQISIFFYNGSISQAVAFENLLNNGEDFANRLLSGFSDTKRTQLVHIATDGETYGHHHRHGEMALAYALDYIESHNLARITNYGEFLAMFPPDHEVAIRENTAWSCAHGVDRWRADCGCRIGLHKGWNQTWRSPLRQAMNWLGSAITPPYEEYAGKLFKDPWAARNDYISVILNRSQENRELFLSVHASHQLNEEEQVKAMQLLEMQRHAMLMFTSCGWFFDDISGIETIQVLQYARRVIQLAEIVFNRQLESQFLKMLFQAKSNDPEYKNGAHIYHKNITPVMVSLVNVGGYYAISSLFENFGTHTRICCYNVERLDYHTAETGSMKLIIGKIKVSSQITMQSRVFFYGAVYFALHNVSCNIDEFNDEQRYQKLLNKAVDAFNKADFYRVVQVLDHYFDSAEPYSLKNLFNDRRRMILSKILNTTLEEIEGEYRQIYHYHATLMRFLKNLGIPLPQAMLSAAETNLNAELRKALSAAKPNLEQINSLFEESQRLGIKLDDVSLGYVLKVNLERIADMMHKDSTDLEVLEDLNTMIDLTNLLPFEVDLWKVQNIYYHLQHVTYPYLKRKTEEGEKDAAAWVDLFCSLGEKLTFAENIMEN